MLELGHEIRRHATFRVVGSGDIYFLATGTVDDWISHVQTHRIDIELGPVSRTGAVGAIMPIYVRDPDGNMIEIGLQTN